MGVCLFVQTCISLGKTLIKIWNANDSSNGVQILRNLMIYEKQMNNKVYYNACRFYCCLQFIANKSICFGVSI